MKSFQQTTIYLGYNNIFFYLLLYLLHLIQYQIRENIFYFLYLLSDEKCRTSLCFSKGIIECAYINSSAIYHSVPEKPCIIFKHCAYALEVNRYFLNNIRSISQHPKYCIYFPYYLKFIRENNLMLECRILVEIL